MKDLKLSNGGASLTKNIEKIAHDMSLKSMWLENINLNLSGVKKVISGCEKMKNLSEFRLINIDTVKHPSVLS